MRLTAALTHASCSIILSFIQLSTVDRKAAWTLRNAATIMSLTVSHQGRVTLQATSELSHFTMDPKPCLCRRRPCIVRVA